MDKLKWTTEKRKISDLKGFEKNPRKISKEQKEHLKKSLQKFDLVEIPAIDVDNTIIAGHQRIDIMRSIGNGMKEIDVRVPNRKLTEDEFNEYNLRSNKTVGEWDDSMLPAFGAELLEECGFGPLTDEMEDLASETIEEKIFKPYKKQHILISCPIGQYSEIASQIEEISAIPGVEIEQSAN